MGARCSPFGASRYDVTFQIWLARSTERDEVIISACSLSLSLSLSPLSWLGRHKSRLCGGERERERCGHRIIMDVMKNQGMLCGKALPMIDE